MSLRKRRANEAVMTFFAFQDVVCCVTGLLIIMALMSALDLLKDTQGEKGKTEDPRVGKLRQDAGEAEARRGALREQSKTNDQVILDRTHVKPVTQSQIDDMTRIIRMLNDANRNTVDQISRITEQKSQLVDRIPKTEKELEEQKNRIEKKKQLAEVYRNRPPTTIVEGNPPAGLSPLFVECDAGAINVVRIPEGQPAELVKAFTGADCYTSLIAWSKGRTPTTEYFVLEIRPQAADFFVTLLSGLSRNGFRVGWDVWPADKHLLKE